MDQAQTISLIGNGNGKEKLDTCTDFLHPVYGIFKIMMFFGYVISGDPRRWLV